MKKICPVCRKPIEVSEEFRNAEVTHGKCAYESAKEIREKTPKDSEEYHKMFAH